MVEMFRALRGRPAVLVAVVCSLALGGVWPGSRPAEAAGVNQYSAPEWYPLRGPATLGCVRTNCSGPYHGYWALDLLDPGNKPGAPVYAAGSGQASIASSGSGCGGPGTPGNAVLVDHGVINGTRVSSYYTHLSSFAIANGDWVDENTIIGYMGSTGYNDPCPTNHLHYEKRENGVRVDPGRLKACHGQTLVRYPDHLGSSDWNSFDSHRQTLRSDGTSCDDSTPAPDRDGDGVPDATDRCPDRPGPAGNGGCPLNTPPTVSVAAASGPEGSAIKVAGTASDPDGDSLSYKWTVTPGAGVDPGGACTISADSTLSPEVICNDDGTFTLRLTVSGDPDGPVSATGILTVSNVAPVVIIESVPSAGVEGDRSVSVSARFYDPGWNDTYTGAIDFGTGSGPTAVPVVVTTQGPPEDRGSLTGSTHYGDNGSFEIRLIVTDDDGGSADARGTVKIDNVDPTARIDTGTARSVNDRPTFLGRVGGAMEFAGASSDPGSDDLALSWDWDDGPPTPDQIRTSLVNPPATDPARSPSVQPRLLRDTAKHSFAKACRYDITFGSTDDDGGAASDTAVVIVVGNFVETRSQGYWKNELKARRGKLDHDVAAVKCLLDITSYMSAVFGEVRNASNADAAAAVFDTNGGDMNVIFEKQLLAAWLNFADGRVGYDQLIDTNFDGRADTPFGEAIAAAEQLRLDPSTKRAVLERQAKILEQVNVSSI